MMKFVALRVPTLTEELAMNLEATLIDLVGVQDVEIMVEQHRFYIDFDEQAVPFQIIAQRMETLGCPLTAIRAFVLR